MHVWPTFACGALAQVPARGALCESRRARQGSDCLGRSFEKQGAPAARAQNPEAIERPPLPRGSAAA